MLLIETTCLYTLQSGRDPDAGGRPALTGNIPRLRTEAARKEIKRTTSSGPRSSPCNLLFGPDSPEPEQESDWGEDLPGVGEGEWLADSWLTARAKPKYRAWRRLTGLWWLEEILVLREGRKKV